MEVVLLQFPGAVFNSLLSKVVDNNPTTYNEICLFFSGWFPLRSEEIQRGKVNTRSKELFHGSAFLASLPHFLTVLAGQR